MRKNLPPKIAEQLDYDFELEREERSFVVIVEGQHAVLDSAERRHANTGFLSSEAQIPTPSRTVLQLAGQMAGT